jgi:hypothetical protein
VVSQAKELCLSLMQANSETEVISILQMAGYWDDPTVWRHYGDNELNWSQAGAQQSRADFALNEKVINALDSLLTRMCMAAGISPEAAAAPRSVRDAVARFIENASPQLKTTAGRVEDWPNALRREIAQNVSLFATESVTNPALKPCINIADLGEGHTPTAFPKTFVSLGQRNKVGIQFVQGKFCQGGSGALRYCGPNRMQLIVSRRHPALLTSAAVPNKYPVEDDDDQWGFTVVRRENATGDQRMSTLTYLAPLGAADKFRRGEVLRFSSPTLPLFPEGETPYARHVEFGTLIKLYEYQLKSVGNIIRRSGLLHKLDLLLPEPALPIRLHECRPSKLSEKGSEQTTTMSGLFARLRGDPMKGELNENLEDLPEPTVLMKVQGHSLSLRIFAFKPGTSKTYRDAEGIVFTVNGQAHGYLKASLFGRKSVGLQRLAKDLLVFVDCSSLGPTELDDLFMSSRDRLAEDNVLALEIERRLEEELRDHDGLRMLKAKRASDEMEAQLANEKPLEDILRQVFKSSPGLSSLFGLGPRLANPFQAQTTKAVAVVYKGKPHPTFFHFATKAAMQPLKREAFLKQRVRLTFETDAANDYFVRKYDSGQMAVEYDTPAGPVPIQDYTGPKLLDGRANLTFDLPDGAKAGDEVVVVTIVTDPITGASFRNQATLLVKAAHQTVAQPGERKKPPAIESGPDTKGAPGISLPKVVWLSQKDPPWGNHFSSREDCLHVIDDGALTDGSGARDYKFYLNADNRALATELKFAKKPAATLREQFKIAITLIGLALLRDDDAHPATGGQETTEDGDESELEVRIMRVTRALAPTVLPIIHVLGDLGPVADTEPVDSDLFGQAA